MTQKGFTLVELMVTVAIVAILASVAVPWYGQYVQRGNRGDGISELQALLDAQERFFTDNLTYTIDLTQLGLNNPHISPRTFYSISARQCSQNNSNLPLTQCVELIAIAQGAQVNDGDLIANTMGRQQRMVNGIPMDW